MHSLRPLKGRRLFALNLLRKWTLFFRLRAAQYVTLRGFPEAKSLLLQKRDAVRCYRINTRMAIKHLSCSLIDFHHMIEEHGSSNQTKTVKRVKKSLMSVENTRNSMFGCRLPAFFLFWNTFVTPGCFRCALDVVFGGGETRGLRANAPASTACFLTLDETGFRDISDSCSSDFYYFFSLTYSHVQLFFSLRRDVAPVQKEASLFPRRARGLKVGFYKSFPAPACLSFFFFFSLPSSAH